MRLLNLFRKKDSVYEIPHLQELEERIFLLPVSDIRKKLSSQLNTTDKVYRKFIRSLNDHPGFIEEKAIMLYQNLYLMLLRRSAKLHNHKIDLLSENSDMQQRRSHKVLLRMVTLSIRMSYRWIYLFEKLYRKHQRKVFHHIYTELYRKLYLLSYRNLKEKIERAEKEFKKK